MVSVIGFLLDFSGAWFSAFILIYIGIRIYAKIRKIDNYKELVVRGCWVALALGLIAAASNIYLHSDNPTIPATASQEITNNPQTPTKESSQDTSSASERKVDGSPDWVEYGTSGAGVYTYHKASIKHKTENIVQVWAKLVYHDEGKKILLQNIKDSTGSIPEGWDKVSNETDLLEINCKEYSHQTLSTVIYDTNGRVLHDNSTKNPRWDNIVPESMLDYLRKEVCVNGSSDMEKSNSSENKSSDWVEHGRDELVGNVNSYKKVTIDKEGGKNIIQVFDKTVYSEKGKKDRIQERRNNKLSTEGYEKLSHTVYSFQVNCNKKTMKLLSLVDFNTDGKILSSSPIDNPEWLNSTPGSTAESIVNFYCNQ